MSASINKKYFKNLILGTVLLAVIASACAKGSTKIDSSTDQTQASSQSENSDPITLTLLAYDSFTPSENIFDEFTLATGVKVEIALGGDAGELVTKASITAGNPQGDVLWGVDNTSLSRAIDAKIFSAYKTKNIDELDETALNMVAQNEVSPVDTGDVCINYDVRWFADRKIAPPLTLRALTSANYANLLVVPSPISSSPGLAFMLATIAEFGESGWSAYWEQLKRNGLLVVDGWNEAYYTEFSGSSGKGDRPIVVSYGSSPPAEMIYASPKPDTAPTAVAALTCYRQVEFAGVLRGTKHEREAQLLIDYLTGIKFQEDLPLTLFVYPANTKAKLPAEFLKYSLRPELPLQLDPKLIAERRTAWLDTFTNTVLR
jgi:thiamine transport system substrate-binding protein